MEKNKIVVVGGINIDIGGTPAGKLIDRDSNPGTVHMSIGGVGHNIAYNLCLLGFQVTMLTALGDDMYAAGIVENCQAAGIDLSRAMRVQGAGTSTYLYIKDENGDMRLAISDMEICEYISPLYLASQRPLLEQAAAVVLDTNIPKESIIWLTEHCSTPLFADPVSAAKAGKLRDCLDKLYCIKPNRLEAELLSGVSIDSREDVQRAADRLLETGLQEIAISLGSEGVYAANHEEGHFLPCIPSEVKNMTGAGDAFMAGWIRGWIDGKDLLTRCSLAAAAASLAVESEETINPDLSMVAIQKKLNS